MKTYRILLKHDAGKKWIRVVATDEEAAIRMLCSAEGCPRNAILKVKEVQRDKSSKN